MILINYHASLNIRSKLKHEFKNVDSNVVFILGESFAKSFI